MQSSKVVRNVRIFRYDPVKGGEGTFQSYQLTIDNPETTTILDVLARYNVRGVQLNVDDKGALDCILRARLEALLARASGIPALPWEDCQ